MTFTDAALLGAVQGATEFLPVSSSGHLRLGQALLDSTPPSILFDIVLHIGTLVAVVAVFRAQIWRLIRGTFAVGGSIPWREREEVRRVALLIIGTIPTVIIGLAMKPLVGEGFPVVAVGALLIVNGCILLASSRVASADASEGDAPWSISPARALIIGVTQGFAILPGISRSGTTIVTGLFLGVRARDAAEFSFLLSIPAILGALVLMLGDAGEFAVSDVAALALGFVVAAVVGVVALLWLLNLLARARFHHFAWYCFAVGVLGITLGL